MMNLNTLTATTTTTATRVQAAYIGYTAGCLAASLLKKKGVKKVVVDSYDEVMYFVVRYRERVIEEDGRNTIVTRYFDLKKPITVSSDIVVAKKSYDYSRGCKERVALLATDPFQRSVSDVTNGGIIPFNRSGLFPLSIANGRSTSYAMEQCYDVMKDTLEGPVMIHVNGEDLLNLYEQRILQAKVSVVSSNRYDKRPELTHAYYGRANKMRFRVARATLCSEFTEC